MERDRGPQNWDICGTFCGTYNTYRLEIIHVFSCIIGTSDVLFQLLAKLVALSKNGPSDLKVDSGHFWAAIAKKFRKIMGLTQNSFWPPILHILSQHILK